MEKGQGMKRNFKTATILFGVAAVLMGFAALTVSQQPLRKMFALLGSVFMISAVLQMILYRRQKTLFKDRHI